MIFRSRRPPDTRPLRGAHRPREASDRQVSNYCFDNSFYADEPRPIRTIRVSLVRWGLAPTALIHNQING